MIPGIISAPLFAAVPAMSVVASPDSVSKSAGSFGGAPATLTTPSTTVTITGGTAPFTHSWVSDMTAAATAPAAATTAFSETLAAGTTDAGQFIDTVTDANGVVAQAVCDVSLDYVDFR